MRFRRTPRIVAYCYFFFMTLVVRLAEDLQERSCEHPFNLTLTLTLAIEVEFEVDVTVTGPCPSYGSTRDRFAVELPPAPQGTADVDIEAEAEIGVDVDALVGLVLEVLDLADRLGIDLDRFVALARRDVPVAAAVAAVVDAVVVVFAIVVLTCHCYHVSFLFVTEMFFLVLGFTLTLLISFLFTIIVYIQKYRLLQKRTDTLYVGYLGYI